MASSIRRPYLGLDESLVDFFTAEVRLLHDSNTVESAFEKPYMDEEYRKMHFDLPLPDFLSWNFEVDPLRLPTKKVGTSKGGVGGGGKSKKTSECTCCIFLIWGSCDDGEWNEGQYFTIFHPEIPWSRATHKWLLSGAVKNVTQSGPTVGFPADTITFEWDKSQGGLSGEVTAKLCYQIKGICEQCYDLWAYCSKCTCPPDVTFSYDTSSSAETIARSSSCSVGVTAGGGGPYSWSVSGTGFSLDAASTDGLTNTLNADGTACGSATITVTDCCGTSVTGYVRCTTGVWHQLEFAGTTGGSNCTASGCYQASYDIFADAHAKWSISMDVTGVGCYANCGALAWLQYSPTYGGPLSYPPPCGTPFGCTSSGTSTCDAGGAACTCFAGGYYYYEWSCS